MYVTGNNELRNLHTQNRNKKLFIVFR